MATEGQFNSSKLVSILGLGVCFMYIYIIYICTCRPIWAASKEVDLCECMLKHILI